MSDIDGPRENAIESLEQLEDGDQFVLVTQQPMEDGGAETSVAGYSGEEPEHLNFLNSVGAIQLGLKQRYNDYSFQQIAKDCLTATRLLAQGGRIGPSEDQYDN